MQTQTDDRARSTARERNNDDRCPYCGTTIATQESLGIHVSKCPHRPGVER